MGIYGSSRISSVSALKLREKMCAKGKEKLVREGENRIVKNIAISSLLKRS